MKKIILAMIVIAALMHPAQDLFALTMSLRSTAAGTYEDGVYEPGKDGFEGVYEIDEDKGTIRLLEVIRDDREGRPDEDIEYEITNSMMSEGPSYLMVSKNKKGQTIYTGTRESGLGASEVIMIGKDFYQFLLAANGKFYIEYGEAAAIR